MASENWLITTAGTLIDIESDKSFLANLLQIDLNLDNVTSALSEFEVDDAIDVLRLMVGGPDQELSVALNSIGIDPQVFQRLGKIFLGKLDEQDLEDFQLLLGKFSEVNNGPVERVWPLLDESHDQSRAISEYFSLKLSAALGLKFLIQALAQLPKGVPADLNRNAVLRLQLSGHLTAGAGIKFSRHAVSAALSSSLSGAADINFFFRHSASRRVGRALLDDLRRLISPFDVVALEQGVQQGNLSAIKLKLNHNVSLSGQVGLSQDLAITGEITGNVGVKFGFSKSISGEFEYLIHAADEGNLVVNLRRLSASQEEQSASFGLRVDMSKWAERVYPQIQGTLGEADALLDKVKDLVPGQDEFNRIVGAELAKSLGDFEFKEQLLMSFGLLPPGDENAFGDVLQQALLDKVQGARKLWLGKVEERSTELRSELLNDLPVATDVANRLDNVLKKGLEKALREVDKALEGKIEGLVSGSGFKPLVRTLNKLGHPVKDNIGAINDRVNAVTGPIREELDNLQGLLNKLKSKFRDASEAKIAIGLSSLFRENESDTLQLRVVIDPAHLDAQAVLNELMGADLDSVFRRIIDRSGSLLVQPGGAIVSAAGTFTRYASLLDENGFTAVFFGYGLGGKTRITADAKLVVDANGNIQVLSKAEYKKTYTSFHDERELKIIDTVELATAKQARSISLATNLSLKDESMEPLEAWDFLDSAEAAGMLPLGTANRAKSKLSRDNLMSARLDVGITLSRDQLLRLLFIDRPEGSMTDQAPVNVQQVFSVARRNMVEMCTRQPELEDLLERLQTLRTEISGFGLALGQNLDEMIAGMTRTQLGGAGKWIEHIDELGVSQKRNAERDLSWVRARYVAVLGCHAIDGCTTGIPVEAGPVDFIAEDDVSVGQTQNEQFGLVDAIQYMREAYFAQELAAHFNVKALRDQQYKIGQAFKPWFSWQADLTWWLFNTKEIRPLTLAFFKTLMDLAEPNGGLMLSAAVTPLKPSGEGKRRISLT